MLTPSVSMSIFVIDNNASPTARKAIEDFRSSRWNADMLLAFLDDDEYASCG
jgi:hypothetical protein